MMDSSNKCNVVIKNKIRANFWCMTTTEGLVFGNNDDKKSTIAVSISKAISLTALDKRSPKVFA